MTYDISDNEKNQQQIHDNATATTNIEGAIEVQLTDVVELAAAFRDVLVVKKAMVPTENDDDEKSESSTSSSSSSSLSETTTIHIGRLLSACEKLECVIRKVGLCFTQSANDIAQNMQKVRSVYDRFSIHDDEHGDRNDISTIIDYELAMGVHADRKVFAEHSASLGLTWLARSINFQHLFYTYLLENDGDDDDDDDNENATTPYEAAKHGYEVALEPHFTWMMQKVVQAALLLIKVTDKRSIYSRIGGFPDNDDGDCGIISFGRLEEQATKREMRRVLDAWDLVLTQYRKTFDELDLTPI